MKPELNIELKHKSYSAIWIVLFLIGIALWIISFSIYKSQEVWLSLLTNFSFFAPLAGGMFVWPAVVKASNGNWSDKVDKIAFAALGFAVPSILALTALWIGSGAWSPWAAHSYKEGFWLNNNFIFIRDLFLLIAFWVFAVWYFYSGRKKNKLLYSGVLIIFYCITFSLIGFDLIMGLHPPWKSQAFGAYFFITGFYAAVTMWALLSILYYKPEKSIMHDFGKLIVTFSILTAYLMFSQLLPIWYENMPEETSFLIPRFNYMPWKIVSYLILGLVYLGPLLLLLTEWSKKNYWYLGIVSSILLISLWIERWWLVSAGFSEKSLLFGLPDISMTIAFLGIFIFSVEFFSKRMPHNLWQSS